MNDLIKDDIKVEDMIYEIRGKQVMLDSDLAKLYQCKNGTKSLNLAVKRHIERFPERFMFQLDSSETNYLRFQFETSSNESGGRRYNPFVFTEQGVAMLSAILKTDVATEISVRIIDAFVAMKKYIPTNFIEQKYINNQVIKNAADIKLLQKSFSKFSGSEKTNYIFFEGQIYDSYSLLLNIFNESENEIIIIDNYANKELFDVLSKINKKVIIISKNIDKLLINKYMDQYDNLKIINDDSFHDRFIILDRKTLYHSGSSFKDLGKKCFAITKMEGNDITKQLISKIEHLI